MPPGGEYEPSAMPFVRDQVELYESPGGTAGTTLRDLPVVILTTRGAARCAGKRWHARRPRNTDAARPG